MKINFSEWFYEKLLREMSEAEAERILGVRRGDPNIMQVYRRLARQYHPDKGGNIEDMKRLNVARDILMNQQQPQQQRQQQRYYHDPYKPWGNTREDPEREAQRQQVEQISRLNKEIYNFLTTHADVSNAIEILLEFQEDKSLIRDAERFSNKENPKMPAKMFNAYEAKEYLRGYYSRTVRDVSELVDSIVSNWLVHMIPNKTPTHAEVIEGLSSLLETLKYAAS
jgi:curved DNA-binding protein CbpA